MLFLIGSLILKCSFKNIKKNINIASERMKEEKASGNQKLKKKFVSTGAITVLFLMLAGTIGGTFYGSNKAYYINHLAEDLLEENIDNYIFEKISKFDEYYSMENSFVKLFFRYEDEIEILKKDADCYVLEKAAEIEENIKKLQPCTSLSSYSECSQKLDEIKKLELNATNTFEKRVLENVKNYADYEKYSEDFSNLCNKYRKVCFSCKGSGLKYKSCSYCNGSGKIPVTWYSQGDWGEKSYTSYTCTTCKGKAKSTVSCSYCYDGYIYNFN